jgi:hypothetical protein
LSLWRFPADCFISRKIQASGGNPACFFKAKKGVEQ